jgi:hypothetical protein
MKAIKINAPVNLNSGLQVPPGSVVVISEGLAQLFKTQGGLIPAQIATDVYTSVSNYETGKAPVDRSSVADFNPVRYDVKLPVVAYETQTAQDLLLTAVYMGLEQTYPGQCEVVDVINPNDLEPVLDPSVPSADADFSGDGMAAARSTLSAPTEAQIISQQFAATSAQINSVDTSLWQRFLNFVSGK